LLFRKPHIRKIRLEQKTMTRRTSKRVYEVGKRYRVKRDWYHYSDLEILITRRFRQRLGRKDSTRLKNSSRHGSKSTDHGIPIWLSGFTNSNL